MMEKTGQGDRCLKQCNCIPLLMQSSSSVDGGLYVFVNTTIAESQLSRYGGTLLGPARFSHIKTSASEVCLDFKKLEGLRDCVSTLSTLDIILAELRSEYNTLAGTDVGESTRDAAPASKDYSNIDIVKGKRLVKARENAIRNVKLLLAKKRIDKSSVNPT